MNLGINFVTSYLTFVVSAHDSAVHGRKACSIKSHSCIKNSGKAAKNFYWRTSLCSIIAGMIMISSQQQLFFINEKNVVP